MKLDAPEVTIFTNMPHTHASAAQGGPSTAPETVAATGKTTPVDADQLPLVDSAASNVLKKLTWANVKATLKTYFDTLYTNNTGTVTSVAAITLGTTGTDLSSTVATGTTTPVITLQVPSASAANRGALLAADWTIFNSKQAGGTYVTPTTLNNNTLPASVTNLTTSGTNTMSALGAGIATFSAAGVISSTVTTGTGNVVRAASPTLVTPTIGAALATSVRFGAGTVLSIYEEGSWTPTDASGAGLVFVNVSASYTRIGNLVVARFNLTFPASASTADILIGGLPFALNGAENSRQGFFSFNNFNGGQEMPFPNAGGTTFSVRGPNGASRTNTTYAGIALYGTLLYQT